MGWRSAIGATKNAAWRTIILPSIYTLRNEPVARELALLERSQWLDPTQLQCLQAEKLTALLRHCREHIPFYRDRIPADLPLDVDSHTPLELLAALPILEKEEVTRLSEQIARRLGPHDRFVVRRTAGTSGRPLVVFADHLANARSLAARARCLGWFGVRIGDRECRLWGRSLSRNERLKARVRDCLLNRYRISVSELEPDRIVETATAALLSRPDYIYGYASMVFQFGDAIARLPAADSTGLKVAVLTSEASSQLQRDKSSRLLGIPIVDEFGCSEVDIIAHQCPAGSYHIIAENVLVEVLPVSNEDPLRGEIVLTDLNNTLMPLLRYRIGDEVVIKPGKCPCGRSLPMIASVGGRTLYQYFHLPDGRRLHSYVFEYFIDDLLGAGIGIRQFQIVQETYDRIIIYLSLDKDSEAERHAVEAQIKRRLEPEIGISATVVARFVERIVSKPGRKFECFEPLADVQYWRAVRQPAMTKVDKQHPVGRS